MESISKYQPEGSDEDRVHCSQGLTKEELKELSSRLKENSDDVRARLLLMNHYQGFTGRRSNPDIYHRHLNWMIDHHPRHQIHYLAHCLNDDLRYSDSKARWLRQASAHSTDVTVLIHAAKYCAIWSQNEAAKLFEQADVLDPQNEEIPRELCYVYSRMDGTSLRKNRMLARKAVQQMLEALRRHAESKEIGTYLMTYFDMEVSCAAEIALQYKLHTEAVALAQFLMNRGQIIAKKFSGECPKDMVSGGTSNSIAHSILGRTALAKGNIEEAKEHLRCKMELPIKLYENTELAHGLLAVGEHELVIEFFEYTRSCWEAHPTDSLCQAVSNARAQVAWLDKELRGNSSPCKA